MTVALRVRTAGILGLLFLFPCLAVHAQETSRRLVRTGEAERPARRFALVVGNDRYAAAPLTNARNDARAIGAALQGLGFAVTTLEDLPRAALTSAVVRFGESVGPSDLALFFFAGHGVQIDGENYLIPTDFQGASMADVRLNAVRIGEVQYAIQRAQVSVLVLDACRNNPFTGTRGSSGLAPMEARGSLVAFATGAGQTASDNAPGRNGLFTQELLGVLAQPGLTVREAFTRVRERVYTVSQQRQRPAIYEDLLGDVVLTAGGAAPVVTPPAEPAPRPGDDEGRFWDGVVGQRGSLGERRLLLAYIERYGEKGRFTIIARERLWAMEAVPPVRPASTPEARRDDWDRCDRSEMNKCFDLALLYRDGRGVDHNDQMALALLRKACDGSYWVSCGDLAWMYSQGRGAAQDYARALTLYELACTRGAANGCKGLGFAYERGLGTPRDVNRALTFYQQACDGGELEGCSNLGILYVWELKVERDFPRAVSFLQRACEGKIANGCSSLGWMHAYGRGGLPVNAQRATELLQRGCDGGHQWGCVRLGELHENGTGVPADRARALSFYQKACAAKDEEGCTAAKRLGGEE